MSRSPKKASWNLEKGLGSLGHPELGGIVAPAVLLQFHEYIRNGESLARERSFLESVEQLSGRDSRRVSVRNPGALHFAILCWPVIEGVPFQN
jgi:hypothetical protein